MEEWKSQGSQSAGPVGGWSRGPVAPLAGDVGGGGGWGVPLRRWELSKDVGR